MFRKLNPVMGIMTVSLMALSVSCDKYQEGFDKGKKEGYSEGYEVGYDDGHADGDEAGYSRARAYFETAGYSEGFNDGRVQGVSIGYSQGYAVGKAETKPAAYAEGYAIGKTEGRVEGYNTGYNTGYDDGHEDGREQVARPYYNAGYSAGQSRGYNDGYSDGFDDGADRGYDLGYDDGHADGYDIGYNHGFKDGEWWSLSVGKTKKLIGHANLLSMAHNDLIDYSKISAPKKVGRSILANGQLLFSDVSLTNKDTMKRVAAVEQYLVLEMAKQVKAKFGLSNERSLKVAKIHNFVRKNADKRAFTNEDVNVIFLEATGNDIKSFEKAIEGFKKGNISSFNDVLERAAEKNGTTPEKMAEIVTGLFI